MTDRRGKDQGPRRPETPPRDTDLLDIDVAAGARVLLLQPAEKGGAGAAAADAALAELTGLAAAISLDVVHGDVAPVQRIHPGTYLGEGKLTHLAELVDALGVEVVIFGAALSPVQQRNLEQRLKAKVIDRTGLILEIFGERAQTREGVLQVELAHLTYQKGRLVRSWTHLERQRGGFGFLGGPGERQIEADRRAIDERISRINKQLDTVKKTRRLHRSGRRRVPLPVVALVGYTNAGKSTLFNRLTKADVFAQDLLFATLDPTMRGIDLPTGRKAILSDTVGFISDLPTMLVAAFRATLEEVLEADLILHVRDICHPDTAQQAADVAYVLRELGVNPEDEKRMIEVRNKIDLAETPMQPGQVADTPLPVVNISAETGRGCDALMHLIDARLHQNEQEISVTLPHGAGAALDWLYRMGHVTGRQDQADGIHIEARLDPGLIGRLRQQLPETCEIRLADAS